MKNERVAVYIDGGNTYRALKNINAFDGIKKFSYNDFINLIVGDRTLVSKRYYIGIVKNHDNTSKSEQMVKSQQKHLEGLRADGFEVKNGKIMYDPGTIREKGVDVKIAVDLVVGAADNLYDTAIIISSDTDLIPAVKYVKLAKGKKVEYVSFGQRISIAMVKECSSTRTFSDTDIEAYKVEK
jgi:uncharacterized LabA/DUF88 family protein